MNKHIRLSLLAFAIVGIGGYATVSTLSRDEDTATVSETVRPQSAEPQVKSGSQESKVLSDSTDLAPIVSDGSAMTYEQVLAVAQKICEQSGLNGESVVMADCIERETSQLAH